MDDRDILQNIDQLVAEERRLHEGATADEGLSEEDTGRLQHLEVALDQCWDLLRQRRALRNTGKDPARAAVRSESTVEHYRQ